MPSLTPKLSGAGGSAALNPPPPRDRYARSGEDDARRAGSVCWVPTAWSCVGGTGLPKGRAVRRATWC